MSLADVFVGIQGLRQAKKVEHGLVELPVIAVCGVLAGADDFVEIEEWVKEKNDWLLDAPRPDAKSQPAIRLDPQKNDHPAERGGRAKLTERSALQKS